MYKLLVFYLNPNKSAYVSSQPFLLLTTDILYLATVLMACVIYDLNHSVFSRIFPVPKAIFVFKSKLEVYHYFFNSYRPPP